MKISLQNSRLITSIALGSSLIFGCNFGSTDAEPAQPSESAEAAPFQPESSGLTEEILPCSPLDAQCGEAPEEEGSSIEEVEASDDGSEEAVVVDETETDSGIESETMPLASEESAADEAFEAEETEESAADEAFEAEETEEDSSDEAFEAEETEEDSSDEAFDAEETEEEGEYTCPEGFEYATNLSTHAFCTVSGLEMPKAASLKSYCHYLEDGYMGYSWLVADDADYVCPEGSRQAPGGETAMYCVWEDLELPQSDDVKAYCHYIEDGYFGFHWPLPTEEDESLSADDLNADTTQEPAEAVEPSDMEEETDILAAEEPSEEMSEVQPEEMNDEPADEPADEPTDEPTDAPSEDFDPCDPSGLSIIPAGIDCAFAVKGNQMLLLESCSTEDTIWVPEGFTLRGRNHVITAMDPADGTFSGAIVQSCGGSAEVHHLIVTTSGLACECKAGQERLVGIRLQESGGSVTNCTVLDIHKDACGCQEGIGIEVRNPAFDGTHENTVSVQLRSNDIINYAKGGIALIGDIEADVVRNTVLAGGPETGLETTGIQVSFGAFGKVRGNFVDGNRFDQTMVNPTGIQLFQSSDVTVRNNTVVRNHHGLTIETWGWMGAEANNNRVHRNTFLDNTQGGMIKATVINGLTASTPTIHNTMVRDNLVIHSDHLADGGELALSIGKSVPAGASFDASVASTSVLDNKYRGYASELDDEGESTVVESNLMLP